MIMSKYVIGIDVGGTNIKLGLVNDSGKIVSRSLLNTETYIRSNKKLIDALIGSIEQLIKEKGLTRAQISGIGIGLPGLINPKEGIVKFLPNVPGWRNVPLKKIIQNKTKIKTYIDNDVNLITLGE